MSDGDSQMPLGGTGLPANAVFPPDSLRLPIKPFCSVPFQRDPDFVDRPDVLEWLHDATTLSCSRMALVGPSGAGKSQIATQFARGVFRKSPETFVFWVNASCSARLEEGYQNIANLLDLPGRDDAKADVFKLVDGWFCDQRHGHWLLILDDFEYNEVLIQKSSLLTSQDRLFTSPSPRFGHGLILFTSQNHTTVQKMVNQGAVYYVPAMNKTEALQLLHNKVPQHSYSEAELDQLPETLQNVPLVLNLAATYMQHAYFPKLTREYVEDFLRSRKENESLFGDTTSETQHDATSYAASVIWQTVFDKIQTERPSAADLLFIMSFFNHQGIPRYLLKAYADEQGQEENEFDKDIGILSQYNLVTISSFGDIIMHPLVHYCTKSRLPHGQRLRRMFLSCIAKAYPLDPNDWMECQKLDPHIGHIVNELPVVEDVLKWSKLIHRIGTYWRMKKRYDAVEQLVRKCLRVCEEALGSQHRETLLTMRDLAVAIRCQGRYEEAGKHYKRALDIAQGAWGGDHQDTRFIRNEYARALKSEGKYAEAERLYETGLRATDKYEATPIFPPRRRKLSTGSAPGCGYKPTFEFQNSSHKRGTSEHGSRNRHSRVESWNDAVIRPHYGRTFVHT